jgi:hypothetical protein
MLFTVFSQRDKRTHGLIMKRILSGLLTSEISRMAALDATSLNIGTENAEFRSVGMSNSNFEARTHLFSI